MTRILYDLALADDDVRPSPYCWIVKFSLLHKGLPFETAALPFADKSKYPDPEYGKAPILVDNGEMIKDSPVITQWLDRKYPQTPLVATKAERAAAEFLSAWLASSFYPALTPYLLPRILQCLGPEDRNYFRATREARFGKTIEVIAKTPDIAAMAQSALAVLAAPLKNFRYLGGAAPNLSDYVVMGALMWQRSITMTEFYEAPAPVADWRERMLDLFGGYARSAKSANIA